MGCKSSLRVGCVGVMSRTGTVTVSEDIVAACWTVSEDYSGPCWSVICGSAKSVCESG